MPCHMQWKMAGSCISSTFLERYQHFLFAVVVCELLEKGSKKRLNIFLVGVSYCGKSFLLEPLEQIFYCFTNPAQSKYVWTGLHAAEVASINNFRWSKELIACKLSRPKNVFANDLNIPCSNTIAIFATGIWPIICWGLWFER